ncbi:MAG: ATP-binding protein [Nitrospinota bacterium]
MQAETKDPAIRIESSLRDDTILVSVEDNGPGIPEENREKVFQPNVTTKVEGLSFGLGLGLSIVKRLVELYNGSINIRSKPGKTVFTVSFPTNTKG